MAPARPSSSTRSSPPPLGVNPTRDPRWATDGNAFFPNCLLYVSERSYLTHTFWPLAENRTLWEAQFYYPKAKTLAERFSQEYAKVMLRDINMEDGSTLERNADDVGIGRQERNLPAGSGAADPTPSQGSGNLPERGTIRRERYGADGFCHSTGRGR